MSFHNASTEAVWTALVAQWLKESICQRRKLKARHPSERLPLPMAFSAHSALPAARKTVVPIAAPLGGAL